jgi:orotidine-5'-phosphate decarboxylase
VTRFCYDIVEATLPYVCAYKPNLAFFEALGVGGMKVFQDVISAIPPHIPVIVDAKRGDIGSSARNYAAAIFDVYGCDAITVNPYLGYDSVAPFLAYRDKVVFLLCRTSNASARDFQDALVRDGAGQLRPLYEIVAQRVRSWNAAKNCGIVVGATYPQELRDLRAMCPDVPILIPGVGAQGGDLEEAVRAGVDERGEGAVIAVSRAILYAGEGNEYVAAAREQARLLRDHINAVRETA